MTLRDYRAPTWRVLAIIGTFCSIGCRGSATDDGALDTGTGMAGDDLGTVATDAAAGQVDPDVTVGPDATATDPEVAAIEAALNAPETAFQYTSEAAAFGDERLTGLAGRLAARPTLGESPNASGWLADEIEALPTVATLLEKRDRDVYTVRLAFTGRSDAPEKVVGELHTTDGVVLARRAWDVEGGDGFAPRSKPLLTGVKRRPFELSVSSTDTDRLMAVVLSDATPTVTLMIGDMEVPVDLSSMEGARFEVEGGPIVAISAARNIRGRCVITDAVVETEGRSGSLGPISIVRGALRRDGKHVGFLRGFFGRAPASGEWVLVFKTIDLGGKPAAIGLLHGELGYAPRVGGLSDGNKGLGSFHARGLVQAGAAGEPPRVSLGLTLYSDCRAK